VSRTHIPLSECGLLSRTNARRYCGCLGEERFDREVGPHVRPRLLGSERFYSRKELDAWINGDNEAETDRGTLHEKIARMFGDDAETDRIILDALREAKRPCSAQELAGAAMSARGKDTANRGVVRTEEREVRSRLRRLLERGLIRRLPATGKGHVTWEIE